MTTLFQTKKSDSESRIEVAAIRLAIIFSEEKDIPSKYKNGTKRKQKTKEDSAIQTRFNREVENWEITIKNILDKNPPNIAWRFINVSPIIIKNIESITENQDFIKFNDYLVLRRDIEDCDSNELGCLAQLLTNFQKEIEKSINIDKPDFVAIDFEHATRNKGTVCSVGIVSFKNDEIIDEYYTLVKPPNNEYEWFTTKKHNINSLDTKESPDFKEIFPEIGKRLKNNKVIAHGTFHTDRHCLDQAMELNNIPNDLNIKWDCTQNITNSRLEVAAKVCNIDLDHHHALSDAKTCGIIYSLHLKNKLPLDEIRIESEKQKREKGSKNKFFPESLKGEVLQPDFEHAKIKESTLKEGGLIRRPL